MSDEGSASAASASVAATPSVSSTPVMPQPPSVTGQSEEGGSFSQNPTVSAADEANNNSVASALPPVAPPTAADAMGGTGGSSSMMTANKSLIREGTPILDKIMQKTVVTAMEPFEVRCVTPLRPNAGLIDRVPPLAQHETPKVTPRQASVKSSARSVSIHEAAAAELASMPLLSDDQFSKREKEIYTEANVLRVDPQSFADAMELDLRVVEPFLPKGSKALNVSELREYVDGLRGRQAEAKDALDNADAALKKELQTYTEQWAVEDAERMKKAKKGGAKAGAAKGGAAAAAPSAEAAAIEAERQAIVQEVETRHMNQRTSVAEALEQVSKALHKASAGVKALEHCITKVRATKPLPHLHYSRGLSLAARDVCEVLPRPLEVDVATSRYGSLDVGTPSGLCTLAGNIKPAVTVMEMLLGLGDSGRRGRHLLLDPLVLAMGCGWRRDSSRKTTVSCFVFAGAFEELEAVSCRAHLPLQEVRRLLPMATAQQSDTLVALHTDLAISVVHPRCHPARCANTFRAVFKSPPDVRLCAGLHNYREPEPKAPAFFSGEQLVQRIDADHIEILITIPHKAEFRLVVFAATQACSGAFRRIGSIKLDACDWSVDTRAAPFPITSSDFTARKCQLISPVVGMLVPDTEYTFEIVVPMTPYLSHELDRIQSSYGQADREAEKSSAAMGELQAAEDATKEKLAATQAEHATVTAQLQGDLVGMQKDLSKKRGKELEKAKAAAADLEEQMRSWAAKLAEAETAATEARAALVQCQRTSRQATSQQLRLDKEKELLMRTTDRSKPLPVEVSLDERRAPLTSTDEEGTNYVLRARTPAVSGRVTLFISGLAAVTWEVEEPVV